jgi:hypothetical protein
MDYYAPVDDISPSKFSKPAIVATAQHRSTQLDLTQWIAATTRTQSDDTEFTPAPSGTGSAEPVVTAAISSGAPVVAPASFEDGDPAARTARQRLIMLAERAVDPESIEVLARLALLNRKMNTLSPRVTPSHVSALELAAERIAAMDDTFAEVDRLLGL